MSASEPPAGDHATLVRALLRERVLDAVGELLRQRSWARVSMADVAHRASVSRQTLYNAFGARGDLARAYVEREAERFLAAVDVAVREHAQRPREALAAALEVFLTAAAEHPLVRSIVSAEGGEELLPLVTTRGGPLIERASEHLCRLLLETWPSLDRVDAEAVAETLVRLAISHAALPARDPAATARQVERILGPFVEELLA